MKRFFKFIYGKRRLTPDRVVNFLGTMGILACIWPLSITRIVLTLGFVFMCELSEWYDGKQDGK